MRGAVAHVDDRGRFSGVHHPFEVGHGDAGQWRSLLNRLRCHHLTAITSSSPRAAPPAPRSPGSPDSPRPVDGAMEDAAQQHAGASQAGCEPSQRRKAPRLWPMAPARGGARYCSRDELGIEQGRHAGRLEHVLGAPHAGIGGEGEPAERFQHACPASAEQEPHRFRCDGGQQGHSQERRQAHLAWAAEGAATISVGRAGMARRSARERRWRKDDQQAVGGRDRRSTIPLVRSYYSFPS